MKNENNAATIAGIVKTVPHKYDCCGEAFYEFDLAVKRDSGTEDLIPVNASVLLVGNVKIGDALALVGQIRTYNKIINDKNRLVVVFFALKAMEYTGYKNEVELTGYFCKIPVPRTTPLGRDICDVLLAVNGERGKSYYIPLIVWGRTAKYVGMLDVGTHAAIKGRLQSRKYQKTVGKETVEKTAYEVSVNKISEVSDDE